MYVCGVFRLHRGVKQTETGKVMTRMGRKLPADGLFLLYLLCSGFSHYLIPVLLEATAGERKRNQQLNSTHSKLGETRCLLPKVKCGYVFLSLLDHSLPEGGRYRGLLGKSPLSKTIVLDTDDQ